MTGAFDWLDEVRDEREAAGLRRRLRPRSHDLGGLLDLASNDYLGLTRDPRVARAAADAAERWGTGATGSRLVTGSTQLHAELEEEFAELIGAPAALVLSSGYLANLAAVTALTRAGTLVVSDAANHASLIDACRLSRAEVAVVPHADPVAVRDRLAEASPALLVTDAVFSVDGDAAPLADLLAIAASAGAGVLVDEAHAVGVVGDGRGLLGTVAGGVDGDHVITATLSKAFASQGGVIAGSRAVIDHVVDQGRAFIFDTALAPPSAAAALAAVRIVRSDPGLPEAARANAGHLASLAMSMGLTASTPAAAVVSVTIGDPHDAVRAQEVCRDHGVLVGCFRPPSVPDGVSRLRLTARADLREPDLARVAAALAAVAHEGLGGAA